MYQLQTIKIKSRKLQNFTFIKKQNMGPCVVGTETKKNSEQPTQKVDNQRHQAELKKYLDLIAKQSDQIKQLLQYQSCPPANLQTTIKLTLFTKQIRNLSVQRTSVVSQLKKQIFSMYPNQLRPQLMKIMRNGTIINDNQRVRPQDISDNNILQITQRIAYIWQLGMISDREKVDEISLEKGVVQLSCKHFISREGFIGALNYQLDSLKQQEIYCPFLLPDGSVCNRQIPKKYHQLFAGYTQAKWNQVSEKFSKNFIMNNTTKCPGCRESILKRGLTEKKVICPVCGCNFCFQCSQKWTWDGNMCLSERCFAVGKLIAKAPWDRIFSMYKAATQDKKFDVKVPNLRACPTCKTLIINTANCKHTSCLCGESFCFVCLKKKIPQTGWPCGAAYEYCGFVAPNQSMNIIA